MQWTGHQGRGGSESPIPIGNKWLKEGDMVTLRPRFRYLVSACTVPMGQTKGYHSVAASSHR